MNKVIYSKNSYQKGKIIRINENSITITFNKNEAHINISFDTFLENCLCDDEVVEIIKSKQSCDASHIF